MFADALRVAFDSASLLYLYGFAEVALVATVGNTLVAES
jgi:hypothetical protein